MLTCGKNLLFISFILTFCLPVFAEDKWASAEINVRTGPGTSFDIMGQLNKNEQVEVFSTVNGWDQILFENVEGYVREDLLLTERIKTPEEEEAARIAAELAKAEQEKAQKKARFYHILIIIGGIIGVLFILKFVD